MALKCPNKKCRNSDSKSDHNFRGVGEDDVPYCYACGEKAEQSKVLAAQESKVLAALPPRPLKSGKAEE